MGTEADPIVGNWYQHLDKGQKFKVVAIDEGRGAIETQHFDGDVEEIDLDVWYEMDIEPIEAPEDSTGPLDDVERDDLGFTETDMDQKDWVQPYQEVKPPPKPSERGSEEASDDWDEGRMEEEPWKEEN